MKRSYNLALATLLFLGVSASLAHAQSSPFLVEVVDSTGFIDATGFRDFTVYITNISETDQRLYVERISNLMPDGSWSSFICAEGACYAPDIDRPDPLFLEPQQKTYVKLTISAPGATAGRASVVLGFSSGEFTPMISQEFTAIAPTSSVASLAARAVRVAPVPNPASSSTLLPADIRSTAGMSVRLYDPLGRLAADLSSTARLRSDGVQIDLAGLADGTYFYQLDADGYRGTGTLVVAR